MKIFIISILILFLSVTGSVAERYNESRQLTAEQYKRIRAIKIILQEVDNISTQETVDDLENGPYIEKRLQILEAVAKTYRDILDQYPAEEQSKKEGLYSMIMQNVAYMQLGGKGGGNSSKEPLYRLIRNKLKYYIGPELLNDPRIFLEQEDWAR